MELKEAVKIAKEYFNKSVSLEEIEFDECKELWKITVSSEGKYKIVLIEDKTRIVKSVRDRVIDSR